MPPASEARRINLAQSQFAPNASDFLTLPLAIAQHQLISGRRIAACTLGIEYDVVAGLAVPPGETFHGGRRAAMLHSEGFVVDALHAPTSPAIRTIARHHHLSLNWITTVAPCRVILI